MIRVSPNTASRLHTIEPLGFRVDNRELKRAGLDYHEYASIDTHANYRTFENSLAGARVFALSTHADSNLFEAVFEAGDVFLFGPETRGLPEPLRQSFAPERLLRLPMTAASRSLNLSNAVSVVIFEAWRQNGFVGAG